MKYNHLIALLSKAADALQFAECQIEPSLDTDHREAVQGITDIAAELRDAVSELQREQAELRRLAIYGSWVN
jgi:hypothetical protein